MFNKLLKYHKKEGTTGGFMRPLCHPCTLQMINRPAKHYILGYDMCDEHYSQVKQLKEDHAKTKPQGSEQAKQDAEADAGNRVDEVKG